MNEGTLSMTLLAILVTGPALGNLLVSGLRATGHRDAADRVAALFPGIMRAVRIAEDVVEAPSPQAKLQALAADLEAHAEKSGDGAAAVFAARARRIAGPSSKASSVPPMAIWSLLLLTGCGAGSAKTASAALDLGNAICEQVTKGDDEPGWVDFACSAVSIGDGVAHQFKARVRIDDAPAFARRHCPEGQGTVAP
jgi:hypothetical protein